MAFEAKEKTIGKLLNDAIYCVPRNQRRYVWEQQNWIDIYDDILLVADNQATSHFIGSIVLKDEGQEDGLSKYTIIDGQQRILTLTIFLIAIMYTMKKRGLIDDFGGTQKHLLATDNKSRSREIVYPEHHLTLPKMLNAVLEVGQEELMGKSISVFADLCSVSLSKDKNIISAFKFFAEKLDGVNSEKLLQIRNALIGISYVDIIATSEEDSYTIFEILNARGLDLEDHELLKNYILRYLQPIERRDVAKRLWEEIETNLIKGIQSFLRHYAIHKYNYNNQKKKDSSIYKSIQLATKGREVGRLLDDIRLKSSYYSKMLVPEQDNLVEYEIFSFFKSSRVELFRPLILSIMNQRANGNIDEQTYVSILEFLYRFFICYKIIGEEGSNKLSDTVHKYAYLIENEYSADKLDECVRSLKAKLPTLELFTNSFKNVGYSNRWEIYQDPKVKERCKLVLELIEKYISGRSVNMDVTIEHILPDSEGVNNAQIGNLFLLESNLNRRCADKPIEEKYEIYNESALMCPRKFVERYQGKEFIPANRTKFLAELIYNKVLNFG
ncbi:MAG: DUF262 domain-containing HNH endonuclease family protein [Bacteroidales bacterium]|nr:DUF262 domain-containing HNH endonuclease family protein [Bacteroidales bacterium]